MTTEQAITMLSARYGQITTVKDGRLERRFDVDEHTCVWEVVG